MPHAACHMPQATGNRQQATGNRQQATGNVPHATCRLPPAARSHAPHPGPPAGMNMRSAREILPDRFEPLQEREIVLKTKEPGKLIC